jgi:hypothetical protein
MDEVQGPDVATWTSETFLAEVDAWVSGVATDAGVALTGEREQPHVRPWSSALRYVGECGDLWFKVNGPGTRHEAALAATLADLEPSLVPPVLAADPARGWSLTRDAGPVMRTRGAPEELWRAWETVLPSYAEAQLRVAEHASSLLASGVPVASPASLPGVFRALVDDLASTPPEEGGLTGEERTRLTALFVEYDAWCSELAASGVPDSVQHDDLHSGNICWFTSPGEARIIDWGDASWGFPLSTMLVTMNSLAWHAKCEVGDPRVLRARDAYLEPFTPYADRPALRRYVDLARRTGCVARALSYRAALVGEPAATHRNYDFPVRAWLLEVLQA